MHRDEIVKRATLLIRCSMVVAFLACVLATFAASIQLWSLWAVNGVIIVVNIVIILRNLKIRREAQE